MPEKECIGKVTATESKPTTCTSVYFWLSPDVIIRPFDLVRIGHISGDGNKKSYSYAIVRELSYITDSVGHLANYVSSDFGDINAHPINERLGTTIAEADVLGNSQNIEMPIRDGARVEWAGPEEIRSALGVENLIKPIPGGYIRTSNKEEIRIDFEARYLVGPEAAHINISGISGLASKTSYAMFLLSALQQRMQDEVSIILFNVKGPDLLAVDQPNASMSETHQQDWRKCGLEPRPLENVTYLYPYAKRPDRFFTSSHAPNDVIQFQIEQNQAFNYYYDVETFKGGEEGSETDVGRDKMSLLFSDIDDPQSTMESCIHELGEIQAETWEKLREEIHAKTEKGQTGRKEISVQSWRKFSRLIRTRTTHDIFSSNYYGEDRRQKLIVDAIKDLRPGGILVVDIAPLPDYLQCLVFGDVIRTVFDAKLDLYENIKKEDLGRVVIFADELNKYAPSTSGSRDRTLTRWLLEITERGRSLGVVLFGAEQFRSAIHSRVLGNCSTDVFGRTNPVELSKAPDYRLFSQSNKATVTRLNQGQMLLQHSVFNTALIKVRFPYPAYRQLQR
ncbi:MAG TPA: ATP-binding protein [candidate division Zixibacteria bacterium]|nr:ATP-binding protein [candidate division Zixibacteria bacterium]